MKIYNSKILRRILSKVSDKNKLELFFILSEYDHIPIKGFVFWFRQLLFDDLFGWMTKCSLLHNEIKGIIPLDGPAGLVYHINYKNENPICNDTESH